MPRRRLPKEGEAHAACRQLRGWDMRPVAQGSDLSSCLGKNVFIFPFFSLSFFLSCFLKKLTLRMSKTNYRLWVKTEKALFLQIVAGMKELVHLVSESKPVSQRNASKRAVAADQEVWRATTWIHPVHCDVMHYGNLWCMLIVCQMCVQHFRVLHWFRSIERSTAALCAAFEGLSEARFVLHSMLPVLRVPSPWVTWLLAHARRMAERLPQTSRHFACNKKTRKRRSMISWCPPLWSVLHSTMSCSLVPDCGPAWTQCTKRLIDHLGQLSTNFWSFQTARVQAAEELLRLTVVFLLNSFAAASTNEVRQELDLNEHNLPWPSFNSPIHAPVRSSILSYPILSMVFYCHKYKSISRSELGSSVFYGEDTKLSHGCDLETFWPVRQLAARLCRFCALFNHSCSSAQICEARKAILRLSRSQGDPSAAPETEGETVGMRLLRPRPELSIEQHQTFIKVPYQIMSKHHTAIKHPIVAALEVLVDWRSVAAGEEITFSYVPLKQDHVSRKLKWNDANALSECQFQTYRRMIWIEVNCAWQWTFLWWIGPC